MRVLGIDIGGAHIKTALRDSAKELEALSWPFELWKHPLTLTNHLKKIFLEIGPVEIIGATMTGELCDCYPSKAIGVNAIVDALNEAREETELRWWSTEGRFVGSKTAKENPLAVAAGNWSASAHWLGRKYPLDRLLWLDIGSTTTDLIPIQNGVPINRGMTDPQRLVSDELIYAGVRRTPLSALMGLTGATEFFASTDDIFGLLGQVEEFPGDLHSADGKPRTTPARMLRLARMLGADLTTATHEELIELAKRLRKTMVDRIIQGIEAISSRMDGPFSRVVVSGSGEFLAKQIHRDIWGGQVPCVEISQFMGGPASTAFPAVALAMLLELPGC